MRPAVTPLRRPPAPPFVVFLLQMPLLAGLSLVMLTASMILPARTAARYGDAGGSACAVVVADAWLVWHWSARTRPFRGARHAESATLRIAYTVFWAVVLVMSVRHILKHGTEFVNKPRLFNPISGLDRPSIATY